MEFNIDIHTQPNGDITIEDLSKEYGLYIAEDLTVVTSYDSYKYSESTSINTILKMSATTATLIDVLMNDHSTETDNCTFKAKEDGYYVINHYVLPNKKWYDSASDEYKGYYDTIYIVDNEKIYKEVDGKLEECTIKEVLERNIEGTTLKMCKVDIFFTGHLQQCYINYCKRLFEEALTSCNRSDSDTFARDFIWMTLNIIDYLIGFKLYMEAERLLSMFNTCGSFCKHPNTGGNKHIGCGCS